MNLALTWAQAAKAMGGKLSRGEGEEPFNDFVTDSRLPAKGTTFLTLEGKNHDAHKFLPDLAKDGLRGAVIREGKLDLAAGIPLVIEAPDTLVALQNLSSFHRDRFKIPVAAVTGSNGKSSTKEMLKSIFSKKGNTCANKGNLNNQYGLPFSLLELGPEHEYAIFELGASRKGDIQEIARLAKPHVAVITNVSAAHLEFFGDLETVYQTKIEIAGSLPEDGTLVYNVDDPLLCRLEKSWKGKSITFGCSPKARMRVMEGKKNLVLEYEGKKHEIVFPAPGRHNRLNAAGAAAAALACGLDWNAISAGLACYTPLPGRLQLEKRGPSQVIFDAYNSNPASAKAALDTLASSGGGPLVAVLGDMKELGAHSEKYHRELGAYAAGLKLNKIFMAGPEIKPAYEAALEKGCTNAVYAEDWRQWLPQLKAMTGQGGTYLLKASRAMGFEEILKQL
ncbi:MAG TPA: UDP-N-acetylmuramoyl-tripeptide--D-alanyl-D-alanine ligase [Elusimicrobiales bacterium]|nr:UDP-N-acetylmuramoyl-tripeptide--D-alanyl-D-alanine ligase [Elusimicrobiales bacterium]